MSSFARSRRGGIERWGESAGIEGAKKIWTALLLSKRVDRRVNVVEDFVAFHIPNKFIVGYGLDYNQKFRDLNHICVMSATGIEKYKNS
ncbi:hypothetical protein TELCIR_01264 [Teladorsagia circumcincta]|uniref:Hypoxanthine phosphoribosyltransferase n=1 Tax=Teladorsagia circumcincta TaxID=45464 RepID=A0A2G9V2E9_TELCI|nr:hypothetical protein TELCIR_01264 [Teladorsagia circumcincta]